MQAGGRGGARPPMGIAFEGDLGNRIDTVLAIAMLNGLVASDVNVESVPSVFSQIYAFRVGVLGETERYFKRFP